MAVTESSAPDSSMASAYLELGSFWLKRNGPKSFYYCQKAYDLAKASLESGQNYQAKDSIAVQTIMAASLNRMGFSADRRGELSQALAWYLESSELAQKIGDSIHLSSSLFNVGSVYHRLGEIDKTLEFLNRSLEIRQAIKDTALISSSLFGIGGIYSSMGEFEKALSYFEESIRYSKATGFLRITGSAYASMGTTYARKGDFESAMVYYEKSIEISESIQHHDALVVVRFSQAGVKRDQGLIDEAIQYCNTALAIANENSLYLRSVNVHERLSELYSFKGNTDSSFSHYKKFIASRDSVNNLKTSREVARLEAQYEFGSKMLADSLTAANQIQEEQLRTDKQTTISVAFGIGIALMLILSASLIYAYRSQTRSNKVIQQSLAEKEMLIQEIHHRVKNNLTMVSNLLELQGDFLEDAGAKAAIGEGKSRLNSIALIHQQLYQSNERTSVEMLDFIEELVSELSFAYGTDERGIQIEAQIDTIQLDVEKAISLGLILHELLNNSLKYAFPESRRGRIQVELRKKEDRNLALTVSDNGVGMPEEISSQSLGMKLIHLLSGELKGKLKFVVQSGTHFELVFPPESQMTKT